MKNSKHVTFILTLIFTLFANIFSQSSGWYWVNPLPQSCTILGINFLNNNTGYVCGDNGLIMKTTNGGINWEYQNTNTYSLLQSIYFVNDYTGVVCGYGAIILHTTNSGLIWNVVNQNTGGGYWDISFINENTGFLCGSNGIIKKTINSGLNWTQINSGITISLTSIMFKDELNGIALGLSGNIVKTTNSGENWLQLNSPTTINLYGLFYSDDGKIFIGGAEGIIYRSVNDGLSWQQLTTGHNYDIYDINFINYNTGFACGWGLFKTTDTGDTWSSVPFGSNGSSSFSSCFKNSNIFIAGTEGYIFKSTDMGINWFNLTPGNRIGGSDIEFIDQNFGMILGGHEVKKTINGGNNWQYITVDGFASRDLYIVDSNIAVIAGTMNIFGPGFINRTTDGGLNWIIQVYSDLGTLNTVAFSDNLTGVAAGAFGDMIRTTDAGLNWLRISSGIYNQIVTLDFEGNTGMAVSDHGEIIKSTNDGAAWFLCGPIFPYVVYSINLMKDNIVYMTGDTGLVFKSNDGGLNWINQNTGSRDRISAINFFGIDTGWVCGFDDNGWVYKTTNGGTNWFSQVTRTCGVLSDIYPLSANTVIATGSYGTIIKTTNGGNPIGINDPVIIIPGNYRLMQNYPNPFNPETTLKFEIPKPSLVSLVIFDILGREIEVLLNSEIPTGQHQVIWNGNNYSSGVYFAKLVSGEFTQVIKMLLLK